ncbi:hypothetical protein SOVF_066270 [Spinacia oleracea]|nr:hypothetical protein SOVF_066270 [Spinacia oleracea]
MLIWIDLQQHLNFNVVYGTLNTCEHVHQSLNIRPELAANETEKKKKKKESLPVNASGIQWMHPRMDGHAFNPCQTSMQSKKEAPSAE